QQSCARDGGEKFDHRLMRQTNRICLDSFSQQFRRDALLCGKATIETVDQDVRVNESRDGKAPRESSRDYQFARPAALSVAAGAASPRQIPSSVRRRAAPSFRVGLLVGCRASSRLSATRPRRSPELVATWRLV